METYKNLSSIKIIAAAVIIFGLIYFADLLTPLALAIFLWLTIDSFAKILDAKIKFIKRREAVTITIILAFMALAFVVAFVAQYARYFAHDISEYKVRIEGLIRAFYANFPMLGTAPTLGEIFDKVSPTIILSEVGDVLKGFGSEALFVLIYVICLFAAQSSLPKKIISIFPDKTERENYVRISADIAKSIEQYLWVQTVTGIMIAIACYILFLVMGLKNALFWALITFLLSYIPAVGGLVASLLPAIFALVQFPSILPAVIILAITQTIQFVVGNIIQPRMTGDSLNISVLMVFLSLAFWGKIWGGAGMFLAVPLTVMLMIIMAQFPSTRAIAIMMSANGNPNNQAENPQNKISD